MTMSTLLHLDASARRRSISRELGGAFASAWRSQHPDGRYVYRDLTTAPVPFIDEAWPELCDGVLNQRETDLDRIADLVVPPRGIGLAGGCATASNCAPPTSSSSAHQCRTTRSPPRSNRGSIR
jgi:Flavodoxin-like fold